MANSFYLQFNILDNRSKTSSAFDILKNKCKKSLANSFENLLSKVGKLKKWKHM